MLRLAGASLLSEKRDHLDDLKLAFDFLLQIFDKFDRN